MDLRDRVLEWVHAFIISDENGELRRANAKDVAGQFGITVTQAQLILQSDKYGEYTPAEQARVTQDAIHIRRKGLMPLRDAARFLGISERTARRYVAEGCPVVYEPNPHGGRPIPLARFRDLHHWRDADPIRYLETPDVVDARPVPHDQPVHRRRR